MGCRSCEQNCLKHCITMIVNKEGFWYPAVDEQSCIGCSECLKACPVRNTELHRNGPRKVWAWRSRNETDIMKSASGGAADSAAKAVLRMGGVVYGAAYDENLVVSHVEIAEDSERERIQSSKYVQSDPGDTYSRAGKRLAEGRTVLFTGTPCMIAGLYAFLGGDQENLYTADLICHGVPSPEFFRKYLEYQKKRNGGRVVYFNFRSKERRGWGTNYLLKTGEKERAGVLGLDRYGSHFMAGDCYRESCYRCPYADTRRVGDLTVGDFWGIAKSHPKFNSPKGISSVFVNTEKGQKLWEMMSPFGEAEAATLEEGMIRQHNLVHPCSRPVARDTFYRGIEKTDFIERVRVGFQLKTRLKAILPDKMIQKIKSF